MSTNNDNDSQARRNFYATFGLTDNDDESYDNFALDEIFAQADRRATKKGVEAKKHETELHAQSRAKKEQKMLYYKSISHRFIVSMMIIGAILGAYVSCAQMIRFYGPIGNDTSLFTAVLIAAIGSAVVSVLLGVVSRFAITTIVDCIQQEIN